MRTVCWRIAPAAGRCPMSTALLIRISTRLGSLLLVRSGACLRSAPALLRGVEREESRGLLRRCWLLRSGKALCGLRQLVKKKQVSYLLIVFICPYCSKISTMRTEQPPTLARTKEKKPYTEKRHAATMLMNHTDHRPRRLRIIFGGGFALYMTTGSF